MELHAIAIPYNSVLALIALLEVEGMGGFDFTPVMNLTKPEFQARVAHGQEVLEKRRLIEINHETKEYSFEDRFGMYFLTALNANPAMMIEIVHNSAVNTTFFSAAEGVVVEQSNPQEDIFLFTHLPNRSIIHSRFQALIEPLRTRSQVSGSVRYEMKLRQFQEVYEAFKQGDFNTVQARLKSAKWNPADLQSLMNTVQQTRLWTAMSNDGTRQPQVRYLHIIETPMQCWLCQPTDESEKYMSIEAVSGQRCADLIAPMISVVEPHAPQG